MYRLRVLPSSSHGVVDYLVAVLLLLAPMALGFGPADGAALWVPRLMGAIVLGQSLATDYELGLWKMIPFRVHQGMDAVVGLVLIASPWAFGFAGHGPNAWAPPVLAGVAELALATLSQRWAYPGHHPRARA